MVSSQSNHLYYHKNPSPVKEGSPVEISQLLFGEDGINSGMLFFRNSGDYGALTHLFNLSYKINDKNSKNKVENIIDLGANIGIETIKFKFFFPNSKIIAVEPEKSNFEILKNNTKNYNGIHLENYAISNKQNDIYLKNEKKKILFKL